jgi:hypothetical protein
MTTYPDDADGAVLAELAAQGVDLSQPLLIEFAVAVPDEASANKTLKAMTKAGYDSHIEYDAGEPDDEGEIDPEDEEFGPSWTVYANAPMIPEYNEIMRIQADLDRLARPFGGKSDGWGVMLDGDADAESA